MKELASEKNSVKELKFLLEQKNRELEIEAALERVRARTMAMRNSDELREVVSIIYRELELLGIDITMCLILIYNWKTMDMEWWSTGQGAEILPESYRIPISSEIENHTLIKRFFKDQQKGIAYSEFDLKGEVKKTWDNYIFNHSDLKNIPEEVKKGMKSFERTLLCDAFMSCGALEISTQRSLKEEEVYLLKRFAKVVDLTFTRVEELQKAEAQARESQIEAALERVRSRTMAMHRSDELNDVTVLLYKELMNLSVSNFFNCGYMEVLEDEQIQYAWLTRGDGTFLAKLKFPLKGDLTLDARYDAWKLQKPLFHQVLNPVQLKKHIKFISPIYNNKEADAVVKLFPNPTIFYNANFKHGYLHINTGTKLNDEGESILIRFTQVFEQTYTRFLDLKKAEAQAREAQIEAALERVRSKTMAMHNSTDVGDTVVTLLNEVIKLGLDKSIRIGIGILAGNKDMETWSANTYVDGKVDLRMGLLNMKIHPMLVGLVKAWKSGKTSYHYDYIGDDVKRYYTALNNEPKYPFNADLNALPPNEYHRSFFHSEGILFSFSPNPISEKAAAVLDRFARVFGQTYRRYRDLQKAEAQAREAQIEAALERVRAKAMAMHSSKDISEATVIVFRELSKLGVEMVRCGITLYVDSKTVELWSTTTIDNEIIGVATGYLDMEMHQMLKGSLQSWKDKKDFFSYKLAGEEIKKYYALLDAAPDYEFPKINLDMDMHILNVFNFKQGAVFAYTNSPISEETIKIFKQFTKVFSGTYQRYLDIVKAENQAREAQIEAALERVRSKAMGLRKPEELKEVIAILYRQLVDLGLELYDANIAIQENKTKAITIYGSGLGGVEMPPKFTIPYLDRPVLNKLYYDVSPNQTYRYFELKGRELKSLHKVLVDETEVGKAPKEYLAEMLSVKRIVLSFVTIGHGFLELASDNILLPDQAEILKRFGSVMDLTYTRFNDVVQAEAQAREAQIEAALERVRSRTMAMQRSDELSTVAVLLFQQIKSLGVNHFASGFNIWNKEEEVCTSWMSAGDGQLLAPMQIPLTQDPLWVRFRESRLKGEKFWVKELGGKEIEEHYKYFLSIPAGKELKKIVESGIPLPTFQINHVANFEHGNLMFITFEPIPEAHDIFERFAKVFEQTYTRFLDLQKAEEQAREAQIESALERVRSRSLAMHKSDELAESAKMLFQQLELLDVPIFSAGYVIWNDDKKQSASFWMSSEGMLQPPFLVPLDTDTIFKKYKSECLKGTKFYADKYTGKKLAKHYENIVALPEIQLMIQNMKNLELTMPDFPKSQVNNVAYFKQGFLLFSTYEHIPEAHDILKRFTRVFEQSYTRFLDLQKAEAQAREAEIQLALERVRARTMAMHKSEELSDVAAMLFQQLKTLGAELWTAVFALCKEDELLVEKWGSSPISGQMFDHLFIPYNADHGEQSMYDTWKNKVDLYSYVQEGKELKDIYDHLMTIPSFHANFQKVVDAGRPLPTWQKNHVASFKYGYLLIITEKEFKEEYIFTRFAKVFEQTYTRFLDLQRAEDQAREAQIETALERIRARALAMHNSNELFEVANVLREQMGELGQPELETTAVHLYDDNPESFDSWYAFRLGEEGDVLTGKATFRKDSSQLVKEMLKAYKTPENYYKLEASGSKLKEFFDVLVSDVPKVAKVISSAKNNLPNNAFYQFSDFSGGSLVTAAYQPPTEESKMLQQRAASVFDMAYRRFLDLKKAEEQAREAQIEAALERIRAQAMAMQSSNDLEKSAVILFDEFEKLNLSVQRCGIGIINTENSECELWSTIVTPGGKKEIATGTLSMLAHPMLRATLKAWKKHESLLYTLEGKELVEYYKVIKKSGFHLPDEVIEKAASMPRQYYYNSLSGGGGIYVISSIEPSENEKHIIRRFSEVFHLTYTRYEDLQKAEARTKEAIKQASVDRVRGEIASMRTKEDLNRITPLIWHELIALEVPFIRCGVFIMDEINRNINTFLSTPNGDSIAAFHLPYDTPGNFADIVNHWNQKKNYIHHWNENEFVNLADILIQNGSISSREQYMSSMPKEGIHLNFVPFRQGMLYVGNTFPLKNDDLKLVKSLAEAFSIAYARYEDFNHLEEAKNKIELTLSELKSAQTQLVHSEKMASLGELTAGIAHEIQNPLNFVNNFSEVSIDLIEEMEEEITNGNTKEVIEIASDIKQNLDKINNHGKRASSIVKGMLQHSRSSTGQKETTDINALTDEYLRLSYHGFRAKDKSFKAEFRLELDESLPKLNVVPQDIGRVLLNLTNNAFYACAERSRSTRTESGRSTVNEKVKQNVNDFKPTVVVSTKLLNDNVQIKVIDNGNGIPDSMKEKIFQPFFTSKPTGSGTGLGLSLSYDIIKAHGGTMEVKSEENVGTEFIIKLPLQK